MLTSVYGMLAILFISWGWFASFVDGWLFIGSLLSCQSTHGATAKGQLWTFNPLFYRGHLLSFTFFNLKEKLTLFLLSPIPFILHFLQPYYLYLSSVRDGTQVMTLKMLGKDSTTEPYVRSLWGCWSLCRNALLMVVQKWGTYFKCWWTLHSLQNNYCTNLSFSILLTYIGKVIGVINQWYLKTLHDPNCPWKHLVEDSA